MVSRGKEAHLYQVFKNPKLGTFEPAFHARMKERKREREKESNTKKESKERNKLYKYILFIIYII
jgi:hypothetical protein